MTIPTALAPTVEQATPKVEKFVQRLLATIGPFPELDDFYCCEPSTTEVRDYDGNRWIEANWGVHILVSAFSLGHFQAIQKLSKTIAIGDFTIHPNKKGKLEVRLWFSARVMR